MVVTVEEKDPYKILGVSEDASDEVIKKNHLKMVLDLHTDVNKEADEDGLKIVNNAYETIENASNRRAYAEKKAQDEAKRRTAEAREARRKREQNAVKMKAYGDRVRSQAEARTTTSTPKASASAASTPPSRQPPGPASVPPRPRPHPKASSEAPKQPPEPAPATVAPVAQHKPVQGNWRPILIFTCAIAALVGIGALVSNGDRTRAVSGVHHAAKAPVNTTRGIIAEKISDEDGIDARIAHLSFKCIERYVCHRDPVGRALPLFINGMDENLRTSLEERGFRDTWTDSAGGIDGQTIGPYDLGTPVQYVSTAQEVGIPENEDRDGSVETGMLYKEQGPHEDNQSNGIPPWDAAGNEKWTITWTLRNASGKVVKTLRYSVRLVECSTSRDYCEKEGQYELHAEGKSFGGGYSKNFYTPPPPLSRSESTDTVTTPTSEVYLGPIIGVRVKQLSETTFKVSWNKLHNPGVGGVTVLGGNSETDTYFDSQTHPHATSIIESIFSAQPQYRPQPGQSWSVCVAPFGHWSGKGGEVEIPERKGCSQQIRWR